MDLSSHLVCELTWPGDLSSFLETPLVRFRHRALPPTTLNCYQRNRTFYGGRWLAWSAPYSGSTTKAAFEEMSDQKNQGYFRAKREGTLLPVSPMHKVSQDFLFSPGGGAIQVVPALYPDRKYEFEGHGYFRAQDQPELPPPSPVPDMPSGPALQEALARAQTDAWDALTFVAEFQKTVETVVGLRERSNSLMDRFVERVNSKVKRTTKAVDVAKIVADVWLELRYAWRPMVYDMIAINKAVNRMQQGVEAPLQRAYATRVNHSETTAKFASVNIKFPGAVTSSWPDVMVSSVQTSRVDVSLHASVGLQVTTRAVAFTDPILTAKELMPYSFILDWFVTIGDCLAAFSPFSTGQLRYSTVGVTTTQTERSVNLIVPRPGVVMAGGNNSPCSLTRLTTTYSRRLETPTPTLAFDVNLNVAKIADLVALWVGQNAGFSKRILRHF